MTQSLLAAGAAGAPDGWLTVLAYGDPNTLAVSATRIELAPLLAPWLDELRAQSDDVVAAIDVPIGLPEQNEFRGCDLAARELLGARRNSVFAPPGRRFIKAGSYADARALVEAARMSEPSLNSLSAQTWAITPKILEADELMPAAAAWVHECHPEVSFLELGSGVALPRKASVAGAVVRLELVCAAFPDACSALRGCPDGKANLGDALDAYAALWTALRIRSGQAETLGGDLDAKGVPMRITV